MSELTNDSGNGQIATPEYDIVVVGAGICGAGIAWDAALRGFKVLLIDQADFGGGASAGCFKIVHGGMRYLQHLDFARLCESVEEQRVLRQIAAHLVHPLPFLIPCYGYKMRGKELLQLGMALYEVLALNRNRGVLPTHLLPKHRVCSREEVRTLAPGIEVEGLRGGILYYDAQMSNCERLSYAVVKAAVAAGAVAENYTQVTAASSQEQANGVRSLTELSLKDVLTGRTRRVTARQFIFALGPWKPSLYELLAKVTNTERAKEEPPALLSKGVQLVLPSLGMDVGVAVESRYQDSAAVLSRGSRSFFLVPWRGHTLLGTSDSAERKGADSFAITREDIKNFLKDFASSYAAEQLCEANVQHAFGGLRPVDPDYETSHSADTLQGDAIVARRDEIIDAKVSRLANCYWDNLISVSAVKYTTFRALAEKVVDKVQVRLGAGKKSESATKFTSLPGGDIESWSTLLDEIRAMLPTDTSESVLKNLASNYGTEISAVLSVAEGRPELLKPLDGVTPTLPAEIIYSARHEHVVRLSDVVMRRSGLGTLGMPSSTAVGAVSDILRGELGWSRERAEEEEAVLSECFPARYLQREG